jgi:hypothetical protein
LQLLLVAKEADLKASAKLMKAYRAAALANKGKLVFVTVNAVSNVFVMVAVAPVLTTEQRALSSLSTCPRFV